MGPTASGKTALAMQLANELACEIISVDSALVYKGLDIGSAKPSPQELEKVPHKLIDIREPCDPYSAADFRADALEAIQHALEKGRLPVLVGGTMLYFKALVDGLAELPPADKTIRATLAEDIKENGLHSLHRRLKNIDPLAAERIHENDSQRIQRALEVYEITGRNLTELQEEGRILGGRGKCFEDLYELRAIALAPQDRSILHQRIRIRFLKMVENGLLEEVKALHEKYGYNADLPAMRAVGYRQVWSFYSGELCYEEMVEKGIIATRQLAKRQLTWLRAWKGLYWFEGDEENLLERALSVLPLHRKNIS
ncbi:MAG: tRNA (adenosine(37)-N6)-dimethylallyltransferase MiaA [Pseudomonadales bacterium]|nr:tRNA (adenosine(37)-N6)-dimethylallyltransferase MiaA [Pseudomonadales bacterium]